MEKGVEGLPVANCRPGKKQLIVRYSIGIVVVSQVPPVTDVAF